MQGGGELLLETTTCVLLLLAREHDDCNAGLGRVLLCLVLLGCSGSTAAAVRITQAALTDSGI